MVSCLDYEKESGSKISVLEDGHAKTVKRGL